MATRGQRRRAVSGLLLAALLPLSMGVLGARFNTTPSLPYGVYWVHSEPARPGRYGSFCPSVELPVFALARQRHYLPSGRCPGGVRPLLKKIVAGAGDRVSIGADGVRVNGHLLTNSTPLQRDAAGRAMPRLIMQERALHAHELLLMSDYSASSFDARYFGPIHRQQVDEVLRQVWTWPPSH
nr:conjugative transfer signal peptidase TraF [Stenotrophomonas rhizophila]